MDVLDRLIEACMTGKPCATRRAAAISPAGLGELTARKLWQAAAERIIGLDAAVHPAAQARFLEVWCRVPFRKYVTDDALWFTFARKVMPPYTGPAARLYRGQVLGDKLGMSWTRSPHIALKFAWFGTENVDPVKLATHGVPPAWTGRCRPDAIVLQASVPPTAIICAPCLLGKAEGEYLVDPRGLDPISEPAAQAAEWIKLTLRAA